MPLPEGITTATVTFGRALDVQGVEAQITGTVSVDRPLIWAATGETIYAVASTIVTTEGANFLSFPFPHVDQPGFLDAAGNEVTNFAGVLIADVRFANGTTNRIVKPFQVFVGQSSIDLDLVPGGSIVPGVTAPSAAVLSVAGETGNVDVETLADALGVTEIGDVLGSKADLDEDGKVDYEQLPDALSPSGLSATYAPIPGANIPRTLARLRAGDPVKVGVLGDSKMDPATTGNAAGTAAAKALALVDAWSASTVTVTNQAKSGHTAFRQTNEGNLAAVIAAVPDVVIVEIGTNDSNSDEHGNYAAGYPIAASLASVERMCAFIRDANEACEFVFVSTTPYLVASTASNAKIRAYNTGIRALAATVGAEFVDGYAAFEAYAATHAGSWDALLLDSTHRNAAGNDVLAAAIAAHFPQVGPVLASALAPRAAKGRFDITRVDKAQGAYGGVTFAAPSSTALGSYVVTGTGWTTSGIFDVSSTPGDAFVLTGVRARELHANVDLADAAAGAGAVVDVYLDGAVIAANVDLHAQSSKNTTNYWVPFATGLDGASHELKLVVKSGTLRIASAVVVTAPAAGVTGIPDVVRTVNVASGAASTTLTTAYQNIVAPTVVALPSGWGSMDIEPQWRASYRSSGATTAVRRIDLACREAGTAVDVTQQANIPVVAGTNIFPEIRGAAVKKGLTGNASLDVIARVDNATDTIQITSWRLDVVLYRTS